MLSGVLLHKCCSTQSGFFLPEIRCLCVIIDKILSLKTLTKAKTNSVHKFPCCCNPSSTISWLMRYLMPHSTLHQATNTTNL